MSLLRRIPLALGVLLCGSALSSSATAQGNNNGDKPIDFKQFIPPVVPPLDALAPNSQLNAGVVGGSQTPYTTAPLYNSAPSSPPAPGLKLTIPSR